MHDSVNWIEIENRGKFIMASSYGSIKEKIIRHFCIRTWNFWEKLGFYIVPRHFYWPIPDTLDVRQYEFNKIISLKGIKFNDSKMLSVLGKIEQYKKEYEPMHYDSGYASHGDGAILYGMVRELKPKKVIEVGSGYSTEIIHAALEMNRSTDGVRGSIHSIEPYPKKVLIELGERSNNVQLTRQKVETVDPALFDTLSKGDILFIDTSHVIKVGNDVHFLYLTILPQLPVGVIVHIHDIRLPLDYPREWVLDDKKFWNEQYLLHMFLAFNENFEILFASNYVYINNPELMSEALVGLSPDGNGWPGSFWIKRVK